MNCAYHSDREATGACVSCGNLICDECTVEIDNKKYCKKCIENKNVPIKSNTYTTNFSLEEKSWLVTLLLCIFIGGLGAHRFYVGKIGTGILMLLTAGGCGIWVIVDLILILTNSFTDIDGKPLVK